MRYRITLAYDGTDYSGWQIQRGQATIQERLNRELMRLDGQPVSTCAAGRTDAGVHAEGQVVTFDLRRERDPATLRRALNASLPRDIRVLDAVEVTDDFHAQFDARGKIYRYRLVTSAVMSPFQVRYGWHYTLPLDEGRLIRDAADLVGTHDFSAFTVSDNDATSNVRCVTRIWLTRDGDLLHLWFAGKGFVRYQVRTMVAALIGLQRGDSAVDSMKELIVRRDRRLIGSAAPARGLTLMKVEY